MKKFKYLNVILVVLIAITRSFSAVAAENKLKVVASQAFYADIVKTVGGEKVEVKYVASPKFNVHFIQPKPSDVKNVSKANLVVYGGLDLEAWWQPLVEAAGKPDLFPGQSRSVDMSQGIMLLDVPHASVTRASGDVHAYGNPHIQMNPENAKVMAMNVATRLKEIDNANADYYEKNTQAFIAKLDEKISQWKSQYAPLRGQEIISYHEDIRYFADFLGLKVEHYLEPKPGIPPTPKQLQFLEEYIKKNHVKVIALPTYYPQDAAQSLSSKVGAKVITICQNVGEAEGTSDVISFFEYNLKQISEGLR